MLPVIISVLLWSCSAWATAASYLAPSDASHWAVNRSKLRCELSHPIPGFGQALFSRDAGCDLKLELKPTLNRLQKGQVVVKSVAPSWAAQAESEPYVLGQYRSVRGYTPVRLEQARVRALLDELKQGRVPTFIFSDEKTRTEQVALNAIGFSEAFADYLSCLDDMVPVSFADLHKSRVYYDSASAEITRETAQWLDYVIEYVNNDPYITHVELDGHADNKGRYVPNRRLAFRRVWAAKDYLVFNGLDPNLIRVKAYGARRPIGNNATSEGRAKNRRVELRLYR